MENIARQLMQIGNIGGNHRCWDSMMTVQVFWSSALSHCYPILPPPQSMILPSSITEVIQRVREQTRKAGVEWAAFIIVNDIGNLYVYYDFGSPPQNGVYSVPMEVEYLEEGSAYLIGIHGHPTDDSFPSSQDLDIYRVYSHELGGGETPPVEIVAGANQGSTLLLRVESHSRVGAVLYVSGDDVRFDAAHPQKGVQAVRLDGEKESR